MNAYHGGPQCEITGGKTAPTMRPEETPQSTTSKASVSELAIQNDWPVFTERVRARLVNGAREYGDASFGRKPDELLAEIEQELFDVMGWTFILWRRYRQLLKP